MRRRFALSRALYASVALFLFGASRTIAEPGATPDENPSAGFLRELPASGVVLQWRYDAKRIAVLVEAANTGEAERALRIPAGLLCVLPGKARVVTLRETLVELPAGTSAEAELPAVLLTHKGGEIRSLVECTPVAESEPRLAPLLRYFASSPDIPRVSSQLLVWAVLENITFAEWEAWLKQRARDDGSPAGSGATPADVVQAVDVIGILRNIAPDGAFALSTDAELKLRALRNPWARGKAMRLFGLDVPEITAGQAPDLEQLLHTKANDNCPVCRLRQGPPGRSGDL